MVLTWTGRLEANDCTRGDDMNLAVREISSDCIIESNRRGMEGIGERNGESRDETYFMNKRDKEHGPPLIQRRRGDQRPHR
jgi:hypothetical protein